MIKNVKKVHNAQIKKEQVSREMDKQEIEYLKTDAQIGGERRFKGCKNMVK